jgi:hypothetical protein
LRDVEMMLQQAEAMKQILHTLLACGCVRLEDCVQGRAIACSPGERTETSCG